MAEDSLIEWTDHTFNPWIGCSKVSAGCAHCYAEQLMSKRYGKVQWGVHGRRVRTSAENWRKPLQWNKRATALGGRYRVFCASLADVFEEKSDQPEMDRWRAELLAIIVDTPHLDWLLLTKRPENIKRMIISAGEWWFQNGSPLRYGKKLLTWMHHGETFALPNVWIGASVENQEQADQRIPKLLQVPARVRFLSMEPLLGPVDLRLTALDYPDYTDEDPGEPLIYPSQIGQMIDWVIVGGESGQNARPMHPDWARSVREECRAAGVKFFFKQWGEYVPANMIENQAAYSDSALMPYPGSEIAIRVGKKKAGRLLDDMEWNQFPAVQ